MLLPTTGQFRAFLHDESTTAKHRLAGYGIALLATLAAVGTRSLIDPWLGDQLSLALVYGAIAISVWAGGAGPATLAALLGYVLCNLLFMAPRGGLTFPNAASVIGAVIHIVSAGAIIALGSGMRTARRRVLAEQRKLAGVLATIDDRFIMLDREWRYAYLNERAVAAAGRPLDELLGKVIWDLSPTLVGTEFERAARLAMAEQRPARADFYYEPRTTWLEGRFYPSRDGITVLVSEVTEQRRTEIELAKRVAEQAALHQLTERLQRAQVPDQVFDAGLDAILEALRCSRASILLFDRDGVMRFVAARRLSPAYRKAVDGHSPWSPKDQDVAPIWIPDIATADLAPSLREAIAAEGIRALGFIPLVAGGKLIGKFMVYYDTPHARRQEEENVAVTIARQLALALERQRTEEERLRTVEALRENEERLRLAVQAGKLGVWDWDIHTNVVSWSDSLLAICGISRAELRPTLEFFESLVHPEDRARVTRAIERALSGEDSYALEFRSVRPDGATIWLYNNASMIRVDGKPRRMIGTAMDITERKGSEEALLEASQRKDQFLATLAHELRNPLAPVVNMLHLLRTENSSPAVESDARDVMERQLNHLVRLVDDLLDVGRITRNRLELRMERVELTAIIRQALEACRPLLEASGHRLTLTAPDHPVYLNGDPVRLAQVFGNLLNNACKYTPEGGQITLEAREESGEAVVSITDSGIGIPPEMLPGVFGMFVQVPLSLEQSRGGLGIGLTLVRQLVEMHGGQVTADSAGPGSGSTFTVRLPVAVEAPLAEPDRPREIAPAAPERSASFPSGAATRRVLVVDDNVDGAKSLAAILELEGHEAFVAHDGLQALEAAERLQPDVVLLDIGLPNLNGFDTCYRIRQESWGAHIVMVAVTGWGQEDYRRRSSEAGFNDHLVKPVNPAEVLKLVAAVQGKHAG